MTIPSERSPRLDRPVALVGCAPGWRLRHVSRAEFRPSPRCGRCAHDALELAAEVIDIAEPAGFSDAGDGRVLANHEGLRRNQPPADEPAARTFPQGILKQPPGLRRTQSSEASDLGRAPRMADIGAHRGDDGAERIGRLARRSSAASMARERFSIPLRLGRCHRRSSRMSII